MNRLTWRFIPCRCRRQAPNHKQEACKEPPLRRWEAAIGEAQLTAAPQERPFEARDRGRPRVAALQDVRGIVTPCGPKPLAGSVKLGPLATRAK